MSDIYVVKSEKSPTIEEATRQRADVISSYIRTLPEKEFAHASENANLLYAQGGYLESLTAIIPVAAHQESPETIMHTISEFARQKNSGPFTIILGINHPSSQDDNPLIAQNLSVIDDAQTLFPDLDIRVLHESYKSKTTIGKIRRDIWNAALTLAFKGNHERGYQEIHGLNQDIDLVTLSPHFIENTKQHISQQVARIQSVPVLWAQGEASAFGTKTRHAFDQRYPNVSRAVLWHEFINRHQRHAYEAGLVIPFTFYAHQGGILETAEQSEVLDMVHRFRSSGPLVSSPLQAIRGAFAETSIRRYVERLHDYTFDEIWAPGSFSQHNQYREQNHQAKDISADRLEELVFSNWADDFTVLLDRAWSEIADAAFLPNGAEHIKRRVERELHVAQQVLERVLFAPDLARIAAAERPLYVRQFQRDFNKQFELQVDDTDTL